MGSRAVLRRDPDLRPRDVSPAAPYLAAQRLRTRGCPGNRPAIQPCARARAPSPPPRRRDTGQRLEASSSLWPSITVSASLIFSQAEAVSPWSHNSTAAVVRSKISAMASAVERVTNEVAEFYNWCRSQTRASFCSHMLGLMKWPLDYMGANPKCVLSEYRLRVTKILADGADNSSYGREDHSWHNCVTAVDPAVGDLSPDRLNDVGARLSDTGLTLAQRCRAVLPDDIELEISGGSTWDADWNTVEYPPQRLEPGHAGCDAWAEFVETGPSWRFSPGCISARKLAQEWMEHHHGMPESYGGHRC